MEEPTKNFAKKLDQKRIFEDLISQSVAIIIGGAITILFAYKALNQEKSIHNNEIGMQKISHIEVTLSKKENIYANFLLKYSDATAVSKLHVEEIYMLEAYRKILNIYGEMELASQVDDLRSFLRGGSGIKDHHKKIAELKSNERKEFIQRICQININMLKSTESLRNEITEIKKNLNMQPQDVRNNTFEECKK